MTVVVCDDNNNNNNNQVSFRWVEGAERSSANGIPLFGIKFSNDESSEDFAILERSFDDEDCIYRGFLQQEPDVLVSLNGCPFSNTFDVIWLSCYFNKNLALPRNDLAFLLMSFLQYLRNRLSNEITIFS